MRMNEEPECIACEYAGDLSMQAYYGCPDPIRQPLEQFLISLGFKKWFGVKNWPEI